MRAITPTLSSLLEEHVGKNVVRKVAPIFIPTYTDLVREVAELSYRNKDHLFFYRGQDSDYLNKAGSSTFYPSIYRSDFLTSQEIRARFEMLELAEHYLADAFEQEELEGRQDVRRKCYIAWSILQHYGVCETPVLDMTHSLRVAATFAQLNNPHESGVIAIFGMPYMTNRITYNSEHDLVIVRLLSICPPMALRPYFQEGFLAGTLDITRDYLNKSELDFNNRLVAKFSIPNDKSFWGSNFEGIPEELLFPRDDRMAKICEAVKRRVVADMKSVFIS